MKKLVLILMSCALITLINVQDVHAQQPLRLFTKYGDDVGTLDGIIKAYYDVISVKKGEKVIFERDSLLHIANVRVGLGGLDPKGNPVMHYITLKEYHKQSDAYMEKDGFYEHETARKVQTVRNLYHVWSTYESKNTPEGRVIAQGINSIELYYDGKRYWILGWFYD